MNEKTHFSLASVNFSSIYNLLWHFINLSMNQYFLDFEKDFGVCLDAVQLVVTAWLDLQECGH